MNNDQVCGICLIKRFNNKSGVVVVYMRTSTKDGEPIEDEYLAYVADEYRCANCGSLSYLMNEEPFWRDMDGPRKDYGSRVIRVYDNNKMTEKFRPEKRYQYVVALREDLALSFMPLGVATSEKGWRKLVDEKFNELEAKSFFPLSLNEPTTFDDGAYIQIKYLESPSTNMNNGWFRIYRFEA